jgi:hypothetical protein
MAESEDAKARRLEKLREKRREKVARTGDTPQAQAERGKHGGDSDKDAVKRRIGNGVIWS